jgi:hypothetical protein
VIGKKESFGEAAERARGPRALPGFIRVGRGFLKVFVFIRVYSWLTFADGCG